MSKADYERYDWRGHAAYNKADFYDLFGPTKTGRKGYDVGVGRSTTLIYDEPRRLTLEMDGSLSGNLDQPAGLPERPGRCRIGWAIFDAELDIQRHAEIARRRR